MQSLDNFKVPNGFRGRSLLMVQTWNIVNNTIFRWSPRLANNFRAFLLRSFGANIGVNVLIRPSVVITYPWKLTLGASSWLGDNVIIYSLGNITIGSNTVISQNSYLCAGDHDYKSVNFCIRSHPITIGNGVWVAADVYIGPGSDIGDDVVIGARSSVFGVISKGNIAFGSPCKVIKKRDFN
jgi:putative colanic acid biosynthesis acetyltransferase WcaF